MKSKKQFKTVMYHYIREKRTFPEIKFLNFKNYKKHLRVFKKENILKPTQLINNFFFKTNKYLLTFDDGYQDHYKAAIELNKLQQTGIFFISSKVYEKKDFLDVNKIQLISYNIKSKNLLNILEEVVNKFTKKKFKIDNFKSLNYRKYDTKEISIFKYILQIYLPTKVCSKVIDKIFYDHLKINHKKIFKNFYLSIDQLFKMKKLGMFFGNHTYSHTPLINLNLKQQENEILKTHNFMKKFGLFDELTFFSYPYGMYNANTKEILKINESK